MPRKISTIQKREWLEDYERGIAEASIAGKARCDPRTVKKGIEEARMERHANVAKAELLKEALRKHNGSLLNLIGKILPALVSFPSNQSIPWGDEPMSGSVAIPGGTAQYENWPELMVSITLDAETETEWDLLREHIKRDQLWTALEQWRRTLASHFEARMAMEQKLADLLEAMTKYRLVSNTAGAPFLNPYSVEFLFRFEIERLLGPVSRYKAEDSIVADSGKGEVRYGQGTGLAYAPGKEDECREDIISALSKLRESDEAKSATETFKTLEKSTAKARRTAEEIRMLGLVPGQCRICRRLGM